MPYSCPIDHQSCEVVAAFASRFTRRGERATARLLEAIEYIADCLPCASCRAGERQVTELRRMRLGKHERNILLYAPRPDAQQGAILDPDLTTHAERETYLRAVRKLSRAGLIVSGRRFVRRETSGVRRDGQSVQRAYAHRTLRLTELGASVVSHYQREMETGRAVRWAKHIDSIQARVRSSTESLVKAFDVSLELRVQELAGQAELGTQEERRQARQVRYLVQPVHDAVRAAARE